MKASLELAASCLGLAGMFCSQALAAPQWTAFTCIYSDPLPGSAQLVIQVPYKQPDIPVTTLGPYLGSAEITAPAPMGAGMALLLYDISSGGVVDILAGFNVAPS